MWGRAARTGKSDRLCPEKKIASALVLNAFIGKLRRLQALLSRNQDPSNYVAKRRSHKQVRLEAV